MRGVLTLNNQSRDGSDAWCTHLSTNPTGYLPTHPKSCMNAATMQYGPGCRGGGRDGSPPAVHPWRQASRERTKINLS